MSRETLRSSRKANLLVAAGGAGGILLASLATGCSSEQAPATPTETTYQMPSTATQTNPSTPETATKSAHEGIGLCYALPDDYYKVTGSPDCLPDRYGVSPGKNAVSGMATISATITGGYTDGLPCPVKKEDANGTVCFEPSKPWSLEAWGKDGELVTITATFGSLNAPAEADALHVGQGILENLAHQG